MKISNNIKNKINIENTLFVFIILLPILDIISFLFRKTYMAQFSPTTFIRPIFLISVFSVIFLKNKIKIKMIFISIIYLIYFILHLLMFEQFTQGISYGTIIAEMRYLINYIFVIMSLFVFIFTFYKKNTDKLKKGIILSLFIYIFSIYLSIITKTYSNTYIEGTGIKGWFESGNSLGATLILGVFLLYSMVSNGKHKKLISTTIMLIGFFLLFLIGTRVGMFGFIIATILFFASKIIYKIKDKIYFSKKQIVFFSTLFIIVIISFSFFGSNTLNRQKYLQTVNSNIIDENTKDEIHLTIDITNLVKNIKNNQYDENYISKESSKAFLKLYEIANEKNIKSTDRRTQQLIFNIYLVKYQKNILGCLFGNGLLNNFAELVLEMEIPAFLLNFGICGFILFFMPFLLLFFYIFYIGIKNIKKIDVEYIMLILGDLFAFALAFLTGVTFFSISSATMIICINVLLINKVEYLKYSVK